MKTEQYLKLSMATELKNLRQKKGLTQRELCKMLGLSITHLSTLENGHKFPTVKLLSRICDKLKVSFLGVFDVR